MVKVLNFLYDKFPYLERVSAYANPGTSWKSRPKS